MADRTVNLELITPTAVGLEQAGVFYGDIFFTCARIFPTLLLLEQTRFEFVRKSKVIVGGLDSAGNPVVHMGQGETVEGGARQRLVRRLGLPIEPIASYNGIFKRIIFGHELGHVLQADEDFVNVFGEIDQTTYSPEDDYSKYVNSDKEVNADYISAKLFGHSALGSQLGYQPPDETPKQWRQWAASRQL
jgi:hypothetical protein